MGNDIKYIERIKFVNSAFTIEQSELNIVQLEQMMKSLKLNLKISKMMLRKKKYKRKINNDKI